MRIAGSGKRSAKDLDVIGAIQIERTCAEVPRAPSPKSGPFQAQSLSARRGVPPLASATTAM